MKFNSRIKTKIVDFSSKIVLLALAALLCLWMISGARAAEAPAIGAIEHIQLENGLQAVEFEFSSPVDKKSVKVDLQRNFIQLSLKGVTAFPAKTKNITDSVLDKVFTYQYQPDLARARVLLKTQASAIASSFNWDMEGSKLRIYVSGTAKSTLNTAKISEKVKTVSAAPSQVTQSTEAKSTDTKTSDAEERAAREILADSTSDKKSLGKENIGKKSTEDQPLFSDNKAASGKSASSSASQPNISKVFASLLMILGLIGAIAMGYRRFVLGKGAVFSRKNQMIQVLANQALGPKRSIAIVKVLDQTMVVGMSGESMTLLSNLGTEVNLDKFMDDPSDDFNFSNTIRRTMNQGSESNSASEINISSENSGIRNTIKKRLNGFKPLRTQ